METSIINLQNIESVDIIKNQPVYDIEVENNHNFYLKSKSGKILVHNSGKSDVTDQMTIGYALNYGYKSAYASPENKPNELHQQKLIRKLVGIVPKKESDFNDAFQACEDFCENHFYMIDMDNYDLEKVLMKARELVFRKGIRVLIIDPFNKVRYKGKVDNITGNLTNDYTNQYLSMLDSFAKELDIIIILVAHPKKLNKINGVQPVPDFYDVKGGGEMYDMIHHGIVTHRDYQKGLTLIRTLKVKFAHLGENNVDSWYKYNINNGRFTEIIGNPEEIEIENIVIKWDNSNWVTEKVNDIENKELQFEEYNPDSWIEDIEHGKEVPF